MIALMVRRDVVEAAGFLDEQYQVPALAAYDYTVRMTRAGYGIAVLPYVYVHHNEGRQKTEEYERTCERERAFFHTKWGVELSYSFQERHDLFPLMDLQREGLRVLEIGCACGGTLRAIGVQNPSAKLYGVELNENAAVIAASFAEILSMNVEELDPADFQERFDYIIMGDVIEHLLEPWAAIRNMRELLVPGGSIIASIPNVAHISNLYNMLCGRWTYEDCGLLDRTHFRFFTKSEIVKMFEEADLVIDDIRPRQLILDESWKVFREEILSLRMVDVKPEDVDAFQWFVCARRV
ncbi:bifunctional glycosyltransferase/class I SAM-dependent methyltransferase [Selenomonas sp. oral taxon 126]|uniref:bifunctional glycosyltransferase/class I SAM-dependent methyltransferase n=1 Tax=Selenomonas sp. oral taxon 126 TaxID=712528 RepID=UPI000AEC349E